MVPRGWNLLGLWFGDFRVENFVANGPTSWGVASVSENVVAPAGPLVVAVMLAAESMPESCGVLLLERVCVWVTEQVDLVGEEWRMEGRLPVTLLLMRLEGRLDVTLMMEGSRSRLAVALLLVKMRLPVNHGWRGSGASSKGRARWIQSILVHGLLLAGKVKLNVHKVPGERIHTEPKSSTTFKMKLGSYVHVQL